MLKKKTPQRMSVFSKQLLMHFFFVLLFGNLGMLAATVALRHPALFRAVVLHVPFVSVLANMLDARAPLTQLDRDEWGDPIADTTALNRISRPGNIFILFSYQSN